MAHNMKCGTCGAQMKEYDLCLGGEATGEVEVVCPNEWHPRHDEIDF